MMKTKDKKKRATRTDGVAIPPALRKKYATSAEVLAALPFAITEKALLNRAYKNRFPKPYRAENHKSPPLWDRAQLHEFIHDMYFLKSPDLVDSFTKAIKPPKAK